MRRPADAFPRGALPVLQGIVAVGFLAVLWQVADGPKAALSLAAADPVWLVAGLVALTAQTVLSALRWRLTAAQLGIRLGAVGAVREYYLAQIVNQTVPGGVVGDAGRAVRARSQAGLLAAGQSVLFERLAGQIAMVLTLALGFLATWAVPGGLDWPGWLVGPVAGLLIAAALAPVALRWAARVPGGAGRRAAAIWRALGIALATRSVLPAQVALSLGTTACNLAAFACCARAVHAPLPLVAVVALVPLILITMVIPLSPSGWGLREGAAAALFPLAGLSAAQGLAASLAFGIAMLVASLPGVVAVWRPGWQAAPRDVTKP